MHDPLKRSYRFESGVNRYDFFQALRLIEKAHPDKPRIGLALRPRDEAVRFAQNVELTFHPNALSAFTPAAGGRPGRMTVNFFGLLGGKRKI